MAERKQETEEVINTPAEPLYGEENIILPRSLYMVDVQAALFFMAHPFTRKCIIALTQEAHSATTLADMLVIERSHVSKKLQAVAQCGIIKEIPQNESRSVGSSKFYVADKDLVKLCAKFTQEYIDIANIEGIHEEISIADAAKRTYNRRLRREAK